MVFGSWSSKHTEAQLKEMFDALDTDKSGFIDLDELHDALNKGGKSVSRKECKDILNRVDMNDDDKISFAEVCDKKNAPLSRGAHAFSRAAPRRLAVFGGLRGSARYVASRSQAIRGHEQPRVWRAHECHHGGHIALSRLVGLGQHPAGRAAGRVGSA